MGELVRIINEQESFLRGIQQETRTGNVNYELMTYPQGYFGVQKHVKDIVVISNIIGKEVNYEANNITKTGSKIKKFLNENILGKRKFTIEELLNMQLRNIMLLNSNLRYINQEARSERDNLIEYYESICQEFKENILTAPERQKRLKIRTQELSTARQRILTNRNYDEDYFNTEKRFRDARRNQAEEEHDYVMRMRDTVKLQQEKAFLDIMEQLLTRSIHLSELYNRDVEHIERHVEKTKNVYLRLIKQQGQFLMLRDGVEKLKEYLLNLQNGVVRGISEMNNIVNGVDSLNAIQAPSMGNLKTILEDVRNAHNERGVEMERRLGGYKLIKR